MDAVMGSKTAKLSHINIYYLQTLIYKQMKTVRHMRIEGTYWNWVSGFKLYFSDDGENWKGYSSNDDLDKAS